MRESVSPQGVVAALLVFHAFLRCRRHLVARALGKLSNLRNTELDFQRRTLTCSHRAVMHAHQHLNSLDLGIAPCL